MPDYKKLYIKMAQETEKAIRILIAAQQECENVYLSEESPKPILLQERNDSENTDGR